jgi:preprotein translocase subunit SecD
MLNKYPLWKNIIIFMVVILGIVYALPNLYPSDPAIQISGTSAISTINSSTIELQKIVTELTSQGVKIKATDTETKFIRIRLANVEQQQLAKSIIKKMLGNDYIIAINLAPTVPNWLQQLGAWPMKLGLDLSGGVHFLLEVNSSKAIQDKLDMISSEIKSILRKDKIKYRSIQKRDTTDRQLAFTEETICDQALKKIKKEFPQIITEKEFNDNIYTITYKFSNAKIKELEEYALSQNLVTVRNRVNELGVSEPLVQRQGKTGIVVELPGVQDTSEAKRIIGKTANLEFRLEATSKTSRAAIEYFPMRNNPDAEVALERDVIITGDQVANAQSNFDTQTGMPQVNITLDNHGGLLMNKATRSNIGKAMAVVFVEQKPVATTVTEEVDGKQQEVEHLSFREEKSIISLATIQSALGNNFRITGLRSVAETSELALLLRAGSLAAPMYFVEERTIGPSLGAENIQMGVKSTIVGLILVMVFMLAVYKFFGLLANIALLMNLLLLLAVMGIIGATLTMPGIAGIVLTLGMAVDANVLIFSRIREEIAQGKKIQHAIYDGYSRAFVSIFDGNITTLIVGIILFAVGTGSIKGFAITLCIGILTSMFTSIALTRSLVNIIYGNRRKLEKLHI